MKQYCNAIGIFLSCCFLLVSAGSSMLSAQDWAMKDGKVWAKEKEKIELVKPSPDDQNAVLIKHQGEQDWALSEGNQIPVKPGDLFEMSAELKTEGEKGASTISVVNRKDDKNVVAWSYARQELRGNNSWTKIQTRFMVPPGIATIEPRVTGYGPTLVWIKNVSLKKIGSRSVEQQDEKPIELENRFLKIQLNPSNGYFTVTDKRSGRNWKQNSGISNFLVLPEKTSGTPELSFVNTETLFEYKASFRLEQNKPELTIQINANGPMSGYVSYPSAFASQKGDRLVIPLNEGISYPVEEKDIRRRLVAYGGHGICMPFWGQIEDAGGSGMMAIIETADDASIEIASGKTGGGENDLLQVGVFWESSMKEFRYPRTLRYVFFDRGGHVAVCKRYREHAKQTGLWVPFNEKVKKNPNIDKLLGAANIWYMGGRKLDIAKELKELGIDRMLWSSGGSGEQIAELNKMDNVLTSRYDIYQDIMDPSKFSEVAHVHGDWTTDAWPKDINWIDPDGTWRKGWQVNAKDGAKPRIPCAVICDAKAVPYARKRISKELESKPFSARFIDTTVAAPWYECYHPDHPMTRSDSKKYKMELLKLIGDLGLVCGSETGHDASVPYCDYFEGMLSLGPYRIHEAGRNMAQLVDEVPPQILNFQINPALRLPLWELVYHDCVVAQWYWGDYNNKLPKVWRQRDLFNALYGTPPMYLFTDSVWKEYKERFGESFKTAGPVSRASAYAEMVDHRILSEDRTVQQSEFSNGLVVTVNFGEKDFQLPDGSTIKANDWKMYNK